MKKCKRIISYGGAITESWRRYVKRMAHYSHELRMAGRPHDDVERVRARKGIRCAVEIIHAEQMHVESASRLIAASRISRRAAA